MTSLDSLDLLRAQKLTLSQIKKVKTALWRVQSEMIRN